MGDDHRELVFFCGSDQLVAIYVSKYVNGARANSITVFHKSDFVA